MPKNTMGKSRPTEKPYEIWRAGDWEWRVLKFYKTRENTIADPYGRVFCAVKSPYTYGSFELGDTYYKEIRENAQLVHQEIAEGVTVIDVTPRGWDTV